MLDGVARGATGVRVSGVDTLVGDDAVTAATAETEAVDVGPGNVGLIGARLDEEG